MKNEVHAFLIPEFKGGQNFAELAASLLEDGLYGFECRHGEEGDVDCLCATIAYQSAKTD